MPKNWDYRLNMEVDPQSLFGLHVTWCTQLYSLAKTPLPPPPRPPSLPPHLDSYTRALLDWDPPPAPQEKRQELWIPSLTPPLVKLHELSTPFSKAVRTDEPPPPP